MNMLDRVWPPPGISGCPHIGEGEIIRKSLQPSRTASPKLFNQLGPFRITRRENDAAGHTENFRINASTAVPRFEVILIAVIDQKRSKLFQLRTPFDVEVGKLS